MFFLRLLCQFLFIACVYFLGQWIVYFFHIPLPGSIVGMVLLFLFLLTGLFKLSWFEQIAQLHIKHIVLFFVPPIISIIHYIGVFKTQGLKLSIIIVFSSLAMILVTALAVDRFDFPKKTKRWNSHD